MDYEKLYNEALKRAKGICNVPDQDSVTIARMEYLFPELAESEDERIRKAILELVRQSSEILDKQNQNNMISWLEKQGDQKHVDTIEPKFKVGDWIITKDKNVHKDYSICKIVEIENNRYHLENGDYLDIDTLEQYDYYLWTIDDAKDGDVLVDVYGNIGIFQKNDDFDWSSYCSLGPNGGFRCFAIEHELDGSHPATKEQRDLLFSKMKESGYQWDAEKKELKLLISNGGDFDSDDSEQKPTWSEDERMRMALVEYFDGMKKDGICANGVHPDKIIDWLKNKKDEQMEEIRG